MKISKMNERITIQENVTVVDEYKNHLNEWTDVYSCAAYAGTYAASEAGDEVISEERNITFSIRYCPETKNISSTGHRVLFHDTVYNILSVDMMNYDRQEVKLTCRKEKR
jgi:SPP1 family predicted phage head-tail adaptor